MNKTDIYNLKELGEVLKNKTEDILYAQILKKINFNFKEIEPLCFWDSDNYSKINIGSGANYELVLICWENNQQSKIHKHNFQEVFTYILKGELTEKIFTKNKEDLSLERTIILSLKDFSCITKNNNTKHRLINSNNGRSVSLHLYVK